MTINVEPDDVFIGSSGGRWVVDRVEGNQIWAVNPTYRVVERFGQVSSVQSYISHGWKLEKAGPLTKDRIGHVLVRHMRGRHAPAT